MPNSPYDVLVSFNGLQYAADPAATFRRIQPSVAAEARWRSSPGRSAGPRGARPVRRARLPAATTAARHRRTVRGHRSGPARRARHRGRADRQQHRRCPLRVRLPGPGHRAAGDLLGRTMRGRYPQGGRGSPPHSVTAVLQPQRLAGGGVRVGTPSAASSHTPTRDPCLSADMRPESDAGMHDAPSTTVRTGCSSRPPCSPTPTASAPLSAASPPPPP